MADRMVVDESQQEWLGAKWSTWGCLAVLGSLAIAGLAIVIVLYGIFNTPQAFGPEGVLSPDPALQMPFEPPAEESTFIGIPPVGVAEFTTGHVLRFEGDLLFVVNRTALDWAPPPPATPETEFTFVELAFRNDGTGAVQVSRDHFRVETTLENLILEPLDAPAVPNLLTELEIQPGETVTATLVFSRQSIEQTRRHMIYSPPFRTGPVRILLVP